MTRTLNVASETGRLLLLGELRTVGDDPLVGGDGFAECVGGKTGCSLSKRDTRWSLSLEYVS